MKVVLSEDGVLSRVLHLDADGREKISDPWVFLILLKGRNVKETTAVGWFPSLGAVEVFVEDIEKKGQKATMENWRHHSGLPLP